MDKENVYTKILETEKECCICGSKKNLEPHHILYTNKYDELHNSADNLIVLCRDHHHEYHQKYNYNLTFRTLLEFQKEYCEQQSHNLRKENKKLRKENKMLRKNIDKLTKK